LPPSCSTTNIHLLSIAAPISLLAIIILVTNLQPHRRRRRTSSSLNPENGQPIAVNSTFESILGPYYKFKEWEFADAASEDVHPIAAETTMEDENGVKEKKKETNRSKFRSAINKVRLHLSNSPSVVEMNGSGSSNGGNGIHHQTSATSSLAEGAAAAVKIRNVEMLTLGTNDAGLPIRKYFDWTIGSINAANDDGIGGELTSAVIMYGDMVNEDETSDR
jgi:hypothetical protein